MTALSVHGIELAASAIPLEFPADMSHGDYATGIALRYAKQLALSPRELAEKLVATMGTIAGVAKVEVAGPGFINFTLSNEEVSRILSADTGRREQTGRKIMVEYTDPNPFKEFHIGHLMSNAIGESIARLLEWRGDEVRRANYQGDVGPHVAKALWGKRDKPELDWGKAYAHGSAQYESHKEEIDAINRHVYLKDDEVINELYQEGMRVSLARFETLYEALGMTARMHAGEARFFDYYFFESACWHIGKWLVESNTPAVFEQSDGALVFHGEKCDPSLHTRVFITSQGLPTYEAKELGLFKSKQEKEWQCDTSITITANEQADYFKVVLAAAKQIPDIARMAEKTMHITHGMMRLPTGKMSSRTGDVITGESLLRDLADAARERAKESRADDADALAQQIAVGAIKFQILRGTTGRDIIFDREQALSLEGDSGPYLQYAHARTHAILARAQEQGVAAKIDVAAEPNTVARLVVRFPAIAERAAKEFAPHHVAQYLLELAGAFNSWYAQEHILDGTPEAAHKVALTASVGQVLKSGLTLLGISAPEKM